MSQLHEVKPEGCYQVGLDCRGCVRSTAQTAMKLCGPMTATLIESTFFKLYPDPACAGSLCYFAQACFEATEPAVMPLLRLAASVMA